MMNYTTYCATEPLISIVSETTARSAIYKIEDSLLDNKNF